jgi:peroxiredoxin
MMIAGTGGPAEGDALAARLIGLPIPSVRLGGGWHYTMDLAEYAVTCQRVVTFFYPDARHERPDGPNAQARRAFNEIETELAKKRYRIVGISSQFEGALQCFAGMERLNYLLLSDPALWVADALGLPKLELDGRQSYARLTLVAIDGVIRKVFYPISHPEQNAEQVLAWISAHGL